MKHNKMDLQNFEDALAKARYIYYVGLFGRQLQTTVLHKKKPLFIPTSNNSAAQKETVVFTKQFQTRALCQPIFTGNIVEATQAQRFHVWTYVSTQIGVNILGHALNKI